MRSLPAEEARSAGRFTCVWCRNFRAFGLVVESSFALPGLPAAPGDGSSPCVSIRTATPGQIREHWSGAAGPPAWETVLGDGVALRYEVGLAGDHRFTYAADTFHVSADAGTVLCSVEDPDAAAWQRQLLDTILFSVSFLNGFELLHASAVEVDGGVVAFVAPTGGGKSSLALELCRRGCRIFCDDVLTIGARGEDLVCHPAPAVMSIPPSAGLPAALGGSVIARFGEEDEVWIALERASTSPRVLRAVYLLDRFAETPFVSEIAAPTILDLLPHAISLPHAAARERRRFEVFSALADQVAMFRLAADPTSSAGAIAVLVEASLEDARDHLAVG
jgi:hypothetical protein